MIAKDLVVLGDVRILGELYVSSSSVATATSASVASYSARMLPADDINITEPSSEGEVLWYYE